MEFELSRETIALKNMCREFCSKYVVEQAEHWSETGEIPAEIFRRMGDLGLMGMLVEEKYGGSGGTHVDYVAAMEEIGAGDQSLAAAWNAHSTIATMPLVLFGSDEQKERWLSLDPPMVGGLKLCGSSGVG